MRSVTGLLGLVLVLAAGYYIYSVQAVRVGPQKSALGQIDIAAVRSDLLSLAQAERYYLAANGNYGTLGQLRSSTAVSNVPRATTRGYSYTVEVEGSRRFVITATPDPGQPDLTTLSIDETMTFKP